MKLVPKVITATTLAVAASLAHAETPSLEQVWKLVQEQQAQIKSLQDELVSSQRRLEAAKASISDTVEVQNDRIAVAETAIEATASIIESGDIAAASAATTIGGYGELHYNNLDSKNEIDLHRFVLFVNHQFNDEIAFYSELEVEHSLAGEGKPGEVEVEQAYIQWDYAEGHHSKMGLFLMPVGIINETHEPDTFYGVERNGVEKNIIPATWWEAGVSFGGEMAPGWGYDLAVHSGLRLDTDNTKGSKRSSIRSGRQKVAKASADSLAYTARLRYSGIAGLQWNATMQYQSDLTQGDIDNIGIKEIDGTLFETDVVYQNGPFEMRALYARWDLDDEIEVLNLGADEQTGWYLEPSYQVSEALGVFARYGSYDLTAGTSATSNEKNQWDIGFNYWIHENVVLKADYQIQDFDSGTEVDGFNLGVGYSF